MLGCASSLDLIITNIPIRCMPKYTTAFERLGLVTARRAKAAVSM